MTGPEVRPCSPEDLPALQRLSCETYNEAFRAMNSPRTMDAYLAEAFAEDRLRSELANPASRFYFLLVDRTVCGYLKLNEAPAQTDLNDPDSLEIERIYVRAALQGRGLGKVLMDWSIESARRLGKRFIWLGVWEKNARAIAFYEKAGFAVAGRHSFRMGEELQSDLIMRKTLTD